MKIEPGTTYNYRGDKLHVVIISEDCGEKMCVLKQWLKHSKRWHYFVQFYEFVEEDVSIDIRKRAARKNHNR